MRLFTRLLVAMIAIVVLATGLVGLFIYRGVRTTLLPIELERVKTHAQVLAQGLEAYVQGAKADVLAVSKFPPVQGIIEAQTGGTSHSRNRESLKSWRKQLAAIFLAKLETNPEDVQFRFIGRADGGLEIVRVDRSGPNGTLRIVRDGQLQAKGKRPYFKGSINLPMGSVYVSPVEMNQERGAVQTPHMPVLRVATPVHRADGTTFGIVIVNLDMRPAFHHLQANSRQGQKIYLVNSSGDYLVNPDPRREFGFELGKRERIQDDFPQLAGTLSERGIFVRDIQDAKMHNLVAIGVPEILAGQRRVTFFELIPYSDLLAAISPIKRLSIMAGLLVILLAVIASIFISKSISDPLKEMTEAAEAVSRGGNLRSLATRAVGEVGVLARAFERMVRDIQEKTAALQEENEARRWTEEALEERIQKERLLSAVVESTGDAIVTKTLEGVITGWNVAATHLYGYTPEEMVGQSVQMMIPKDKKEELPRILGMIRRGDMVEHFETVRVTKGGSPIDVSLTVSPIKSTSGEIVGASAIARDITKRKRAEELFRLAVNASPSGMIMVDVEGNIQLANDESARMFNYDREELIGKRIEDLIPSLNLMQQVEHRRNFFSDPTARSMGAGRETLGRRKDGSEFPVEIGLNPTKAETGLVVLVAIVDITERKEAERLINAHAEELRRSNAELEQFAYVASHDLQEPLRMVTSYTELLAERYRSQLDERADKYIRYIVDGTRRMKQLINDLLAFSRLNTQAKPFEAIDCGLVIKQVLTGMKTSISESGAQVECKNLPVLYAEPTQIGRLFQNLISNAIKFHSDQTPVIRISAERSDGMWTFAVKDNGIGIDEAFSDRIFQMFQRLHGRDEYDGNGIGLALARKIVERHGGRIWFKSGSSGGTTFYFTMPGGHASYEQT
jgi:PAS domain S-box-containing protein